MKISKNTVLGLGVLSALVALFIAVPVKSALAAPVTGTDLNNATYTFLDGGNITVDITGQPQVIFVDKQSNSNPKNYIPNSLFCNPPGGGSYGINIADNTDMRKNPISATIHVGNLVGAKCTLIPDQTISITNTNALGATDYQWDSADIVSLNGAQDSVTFSPVPNGNTVSDVAYGSTGSGACGYSKFILLNSAHGNYGTYYELSEILVARGIPTASQNLPDALKTYLDETKCHVTKGPVNVSIAGKQGQAAAGSSGNTGSAGDSCDLSANGLSLAWLMCPLLASANDLVNGSDQSGTGGLLGLYEGQLSFNVNRDLGVVGGKADNKVQTTWSLIKNIATAILVIIMLVAIFSQSISAGPFDAYTIRKVLPRLIAAAIFIQLSWYVAAWVVDLVDDLGHSLFYLLYAPFGGTDALQYGRLLANGGIGTADAAVINYVVLLPALLVIGLAALPTMLFMVFSVIVAILTALIVLVFRKIIIITCLIFAPLAILAWILPGTQRYWKMWFDNFIKVLFMYPLIVALIAAGHIFGYIVGTQNNNKFLNFILITIGVFGPLFILPKTFKWGGQFMSLAGGAVTSLGDKTRKAGEEPIKGWTKRNVQGRFAKKYAPKGAPGSTLRNRTMNSLLGGRVIPTKYRSAILTQSGDKWNEERDAEAQALMKRKGEVAMKQGYEAGLLTDDKTGFAKYKTVEGDDSKILGLDEDGNEKVVLHRDVDVKTGKVTYFTDEAKTKVADDDAMKLATKVKVDNYEQADKRTLTGVSAMKQMWVDLADQSDNAHERKMAVRQLTATSSWPEIQGAVSRGGKKVLDMDAWASSITTSLEDYPKVLRSRVDAAPHVVDIGNKALEVENSRRVAAKEEVLTGQAAVDYKSAARLTYSIKDQMSNEDFATQSEGFWQETARIASQKDPETGEFTTEATKIQTVLRDRFNAIKSIGGTAPQQLLGHLVGGSVQTEVETALNGRKVDPAEAGVMHIQEFMTERGGDPSSPVTPTTPTPSAGGDTPTEGDSGPLHPPSS